MGTKNSTKQSDSATTTDETRSDPITVGPDRAQALAAGFDGVYHIFGGRVENWDVTEDGLVANGFTVNSEYDPEAILSLLASHVRRAPLMPTLAWIMGQEPDDFASPQAVTTYTVQYFKGTEDGGSKVPEWVRKAAQAYKDSREGFYQRRGPKPKGINFKNLNEVNVDTFAKAEVDPAMLQHLIAVATEALNSKSTANTEAAEAVEA